MCKFAFMVFRYVMAMPCHKHWGVLCYERGVYLSTARIVAIECQQPNTMVQLRFSWVINNLFNRRIFSLMFYVHSNRLNFILFRCSYNLF